MRLRDIAMFKHAAKRRKRLAVVLGALTLGVVAYSGSLSGTSMTVVDLAFFLALVSTVLAGVFLVLRRPENPIGLLLVTFGFSFTLGSTADVIAASESPMASWSAWLSTWQWATGLVILLILLPLLFPEGHLPSPRYRWVIPTAMVALILIILGNAFRPTATLESDSGEVVVDLPVTLPLPLEVFDALASAGMAMALVAVGGAIAGVVRRFRRSTGLERQQMRVFGAGLIAAVVMVAINLILYEFGLGVVGNILFCLAILIIVASIAVAVLRYRLYDLGTVISRTITYSIVAVLVALLYAFGAVWLPTFLAGGQSPLFVAGTTLVVAAMFNPTRRRVMTWVDRRFNRSRYQAEGILEQFAASLQARHQTEEIMSGWLEVVSSTLQPAATGLWIRSRGTEPPDLGTTPARFTSVARLPER